jgi:hypothetical protein
MLTSRDWRPILIQPTSRACFPRIANPVGYIGNLDIAIDCPPILGGTDVPLYRAVEHGAAGGVIDRLAVVVVHCRLPPVISDEIPIVDGAAGGLCSTWTHNTPGTGRVAALDSRGATIEHDRRG